MITYRVDDMTCGHCVRAITQAVQAVDPEARVAIDLAQHSVRIDTARAGDEALRAAISGAGYTPQLSPPTQESAGTTPLPAARAGCRGGGCGCR
jgi:copper chaperone